MAAVRTLGLVDHEVDESGTEETAGSPDEEHLGSNVRVALVSADKIWRGIGNSLNTLDTALL